MKIIDKVNHNLMTYTIDYENGVFCDVEIRKNGIGYNFRDIDHCGLYHINDEFLNKIIYEYSDSEFQDRDKGPKLYLTGSLDPKVRLELESFDKFNELYYIRPFISRCFMRNFITKDYVPVLDKENIKWLYENNSKQLSLSELIDLWDRSSFTITKLLTNLTDNMLGLTSRINLYYMMPVELNNDFISYIARDDYTNESYADKFIEMLTKS